MSPPGNHRAQTREASAAASERQFHTLADSIPQLVWMADARGAIYWFQQSLVRIHGRPAGEVNCAMAGTPFSASLEPRA